MQHRFYRGLHYNTEKRIITNSEGRNQHSEVDVHNEHQPQGDNSRISTSARLAKQYNVSPMTIRRDAQLANALVAIGETSPEIKMDILTGKLHISNKQLHELASGTKEDIKELIKQIEEGTFVSRAPVGTQDENDEPADHIDPETETQSDYSDMRPWEQSFTKMTDDFRQVLRSHSKTDDTKSVKSALRDYISMLEDLYKNL